MSEIEPPSRWAADAVAYDAWFDSPWGAYASAIEHRLLLDAAPPLAGLCAIDAGSGTGRFSARLEAAGASVIAVDRDPASLAIARNRIRGGVVEGDVHHLPFADARFDVTFAVTVCEFTADPAAVMAELARITRPGGAVIIGSLQKDSPWGWWNRRQFDRPLWDAARFVDHDELEYVARRHGTTQRCRGLYAPTALPGPDRWGSVLERLGRRLAPGHAAFEVLTLALPADPFTGTGAAPTE